MWRLLCEPLKSVTCTEKRVSRSDISVWNTEDRRCLVLGKHGKESVEAGDYAVWKEQYHWKRWRTWSEGDGKMGHASCNGM